jgi:ADP-ribose pyrophosphatase
MIVPVTNDGKLILVKQYRYLWDRDSIEFPCGGVKKGKSHEEMAIIELGEETGYRSDDIERIGEFNPYNGVTNEVGVVFIARNLEPSDSKPDETEEFETVQCTPSELDEKIRMHEIWDGMTLACWMMVRNRFCE